MSVLKENEHKKKKHFRISQFIVKFSYSKLWNFLTLQPSNTCTEFMTQVLVIFSFRPSTLISNKTFDIKKYIEPQKKRE